MGLIIPQTVKVRIGAANYQYYKEKGYMFKKCGDSIEVNVLDLAKGSGIKVKCKCDFCGQETQISYCDVIKNKKNGMLLCCNNTFCKNKKREDTSIKKYGVKSNFQLKTVQDKRKDTWQKKYGVDNPSQSEEVKRKIKETCKKNYGVEHPMQSSEIRKKAQETCQIKYGGNSPMCSKEVQDKVKATCEERYGVEYASQSQEIKDKKIKTCREHFGVDHPFQSSEVQDKSAKTLKEKYGEDITNINQVKEIRDKIKATCREHLGVDCPLKSDVVKDKIKATNVEKYGSENPFGSKKIQKKIKETMITKHGVEHAMQNKEIQERAKATCKERYGSENYFSSDDFKNKIRDIWSFNGHDGPCSRQQRYIANLTNGKINAVISGYWADIFMEKENIIIEYDGGGHFLGDKINGNISPTKESILREKQRENKIINNKHRMIRFIATKDRIPSDEVILNLIEGFKNSDFKVNRVNFEEGTIDRDYQEKWYCNFGKLRKITKEDLEPFEKQEEDTSKISKN